MEHPSSVGSGLLSGLSSSTFSTDLDLVKGMKANPFKFWINPKYPEKTPARISFCRVPNYEHNGFEHNVWEAKVTIPAMDYECWEASFHPPSFVVFKAPSLSYWEKNGILHNPKCHDVKDKTLHPFPVNPTMKKAHTALEVAIGKNPSPDFNWLEYDVSAVLDNSVLSGQMETIKKERQKLKKDGQHAVVMTWKIAEAGGIQTQKQTDAIPDNQSLLDM